MTGDLRFEDPRLVREPMTVAGGPPGTFWRCSAG